MASEELTPEEQERERRERMARNLGTRRIEPLRFNPIPTDFEICLDDHKSDIVTDEAFWDEVSAVEGFEEEEGPAFFGVVEATPAMEAARGELNAQIAEMAGSRSEEGDDAHRARLYARGMISEPPHGDGVQED